MGRCLVGASTVKVTVRQSTKFLNTNDWNPGFHDLYRQTRILQT